MAIATRRRRRRLKAEINVVPYIDVMLVLLIIFMVTAPLMNLGTDIRLPDSRAQALKTPKDPVIVSLYRDGGYALMVDGRNERVDAETLTQRLAALHRGQPDAGVLVNGDRDASYQTIMAGIDLINAAGVTKVSLISRGKEAPR